MVFRIEVQGLKELHTFTVKLPKKMEQIMRVCNVEFTEKVRRTAMDLAPRNTGRLADSIELQKTKTKGMINQIKLVVLSPYGIFQEEGFKPHIIPRAYLQIPAPGQRINKKLIKLTGGYVMVSKFTPFVKPAIEFEFSNYDSIINRNIREVLNQK